MTAYVYSNSFLTPLHATRLTKNVAVSTAGAIIRLRICRKSSFTLAFHESQPISITLPISRAAPRLRVHRQSATHKSRLMV